MSRNPPAPLRPATAPPAGLGSRAAPRRFAKVLSGVHAQIVVGDGKLLRYRLAVEPEKDGPRRALAPRHVPRVGVYELDGRAPRQLRTPPPGGGRIGGGMVRIS